MPDINRIVITRLFLAWLIVSLLTGSTIYLIENKRIDDAVIALAIAEARRFAAEGIEPRDLTPSRLAPRRKRALKFLNANSTVMESFDQRGKTRFKVENPALMHLMKSVAEQLFAKDDVVHYEKFTVAGQTLVHTQVPVPSPRGANAGFFQAVFVIDPDDLAQRDAEVKRVVIIAVFCVLCATLLLYPVIISLKHLLIRFSDRVIRSNLEIVTILGAAIAERDSETGAHNYRVTLYAIRLAEAIGIDKVDMRALILGAFLHDVGKIGIRDDILHKPAGLDEQEAVVMRTHVQMGVAIIQPSEWLQAARDVIEYHHEKFDGSGYLKGLRGDAIPLVARIFAIADVFDALTSRRPYKEPWPVDDALARIEKNAGSHFDPVLVAAFRPIAGEIYRQYGQADEAQLNLCLRQLVRQHYLRFLTQIADEAPQSA